MSKSSLDAFIQTINDAGLNTASEVRDVFQGIADELYSPAITLVKGVSNQLITFPENVADLSIAIKLTKKGNLVTIWGEFIYSPLGNHLIPVEGEIVFTLNNSKYHSVGRHSTTLNQLNGRNSVQKIWCDNEGVFYIIASDVQAPNLYTGTYTFNMTYISNDL